MIKHRLFTTFTTLKVSKYGVFSGPFFLVFGLNTERYSVGNYEPEKTPYLDVFHAVYFIENKSMPAGKSISKSLKIPDLLNLRKDVRGNWKSLSGRGRRVHDPLFLFQAIVCHFLVNDTGSDGWKKKLTTYDMGDKRSRNAIFRMRYFLNDPFHSSQFQTKFARVPLWQNTKK